MASRTTQEIYEDVTATIDAALEKGIVIWRKPWTDHNNPVTGTQYRGINPLLLEVATMAKGFTDRRWVTFKGAKTLGGKVSKGEKGTTIVFWKFLKGTDRATGEDRTIPMLRHFTVFCVEQCEGLELPLVGLGEALNPIEAADQVVAAFTDSPEMVEGGGGAWYQPSTDQIGMPDRANFDSPEAWYKTLFHEMAHSTGHESRLGNGLCGPDQERGRKELGAEMTAAMLCGQVGILTDDSADQSAAYIAGWRQSLKDDPRALIWAASRAQKAAAYISGERKEEKVTENATA